MRFTQAILRTPGPDCGDGLTTANLGAPDYERLLAQHAVYREALEQLGLECTVLDSLPGAPDAWFVEDAAIVTPELAVITRPGAEARRAETATIEATLTGLKPIVRINAPATLDGGDVMFTDAHCFIGLSERTNRDGARQLAEHLSKIGTESTAVELPAGLHLKSSVNYVGENRLIITRAFARHPAFGDYEHIVLDPQENYAANTLWINGTLLTPVGYPDTHRRLEALGYPVIPLEMSEPAKMDGGLSCLSLRF